MPSSPLAEARKQVRNAYGAAFASKASDALVLSIAQPLTFSRESVAKKIAFASGPSLRVTAESTGSVAIAAAPVSSPSSNVIVEISHPEIPRQVEAEATHEGWQELSSTLEKLGLESVMDAAASAKATKGAKGAQKSTTKATKAVVEAAIDGDVLGAAAFRTRTSLSGKGIVVAILDTEIAYKHTAFGSRVILKENYTREPWGHPDVHGTAVAGLLAASARALTGIVPAVTIYHYKVLATTEENNADDFGGALAIQQALEDGAQIANCSWGIGPAGDGTSREARAFDQAWDLGLVIVKSAGNDGEGGVTRPADARGVIVVGATDRAGKKVIPQSSRGPAPNGRQLDCVAPGGSADDYLTSCQVDGKIGRVGFGTSLAAPQIAGLLALLLEEDRSRDPEALREALGMLCQKLADFDVRAQGRGLPVMS